MVYLNTLHAISLGLAVLSVTRLLSDFSAAAASLRASAAALAVRNADPSFPHPEPGVAESKFGSDEALGSAKQEEPDACPRRVPDCGRHSSLLLVALIVFSLLYLAPGDPANIIAGN